MTRGNQRELARAKNLKKNVDQKKRADDGLTVEQRKARDAEMMREKQRQKEEKQQGGGTSTSSK